MKARQGRTAVRFTVFGIVQGVGFRPFVYRLAGSLGLCGWVRNSGAGVEIHIEGRPEDVDRTFPERLRAELPPLARIERLDKTDTEVRGFRGFKINKTGHGSSFVFISPDIATCDDCLAEIRTPGERRYGYAFTNCTNCGPRYTIVRDLPYDRPGTTMAGFKMCPDCRKEYEDPLDRRHHAQPIACPVCGPGLVLKEAASGRTIPGGIAEAADLIKAGRILAIKGLGGFHLVCDPFNRRTVARLRKIKARKRKPLALMAADIETVLEYARVGREEKELLQSPRRPIVLLKKKKDIPGMAPGLDEIGFMLPYTPLHHLLLDRLGLIVATSSNCKDAPIMKDDSEGAGKLAEIILTHNRPIAMRADDSVVKAVGGRRLFVRRARGYVPYPQKVPAGLGSDRMFVALGGELKDTISIYKEGYVVTSQFLGDLDDYRNFGYFKETLAHLLHIFDVKPDAVITDLHPAFRTTLFAAETGLPHYKVQHHYSHALAVMLEHGFPPGKKALAAVFDGYGYGSDGGAWGGEFLLADYNGFERFANFKPVRLPGLDLAAAEPWRMALAFLYEAFGEDLPRIGPLQVIGERRKRAVLGMIKSGLRSPYTSSCGRLFDAVSFLIGLAPGKLEFESEAAMLLESACGRIGGKRAYPIEFQPSREGPGYEVSFIPTIRALVRDIGKGLPTGSISARFHLTVAGTVVKAAELARKSTGTDSVILSGGCFLNRVLMETVERELAAGGFNVLRPSEYSPSDESVSVGQIAWALANIRKPGRRAPSRSGS